MTVASQSRHNAEWRSALWISPVDAYIAPEPPLAAHWSIGSKTNGPGFRTQTVKVPRFPAPRAEPFCVLERVATQNDPMIDVIVSNDSSCANEITLCDSYTGDVRIPFTFLDEVIDVLTTLDVIKLHGIPSESFWFGFMKGTSGHSMSSPGTFHHHISRLDEMVSRLSEKLVCSGPIAASVYANCFLFSSDDACALMLVFCRQ
jgi:hypothetical protein